MFSMKVKFPEISTLIDAALALRTEDGGEFRKMD